MLVEGADITLKMDTEQKRKCNLVCVLSATKQRRKKTQSMCSHSGKCMLSWCSDPEKGEAEQLGKQN